MNYALVKDGVVINIVTVDYTAIDERMTEYEAKLPAYKKALEDYEDSVTQYDLKRLEFLEEYRIAKEQGRKMSRHVIRPIPPKGVPRLNKPLGRYVPDEGCELVEIDGECNIGYSYKNGKFTKSEEE